MAKTDNLTDFMVDLADGIRAKKGTTEPINPQDFRKEIESISGGGESGGSTIEYLDVSGSDLGTILSMLGIYVRVVSGDKVSILPAAYADKLASDEGVIIAVSIDFSALLVENVFSGYNGTVGDWLTSYGVDTSSVPRITKEQFYSLE